MRRVSHWYGLMAIWALVGSAVSAVVILHHGLGLPGAGQVVADVVSAAILLGVGRAAKRQGARPAGAGGVAGLIYGIVSGWPVFLTHLTRADVLRRLHGRTLPAGTLRLAVQAANSPAAHVVTWLTVIVVGLVAGLVLGSVGGLLSRRPSSALDV
jgi:hypothetical protein